MERSVVLNPKIEKIANEIEKLRSKMSSYQNRLRELERQKTELENADIVAAVRGVDISHNELADFMRMFKEQQSGTVPNLDKIQPHIPKTQNDKEDEPIEN
jgi:flagellar biosynthesis chaperone FliJ